MRVVLAILLLVNLPVQAQSWCPPGATWTHTYAGYVGTGYARSAYVGDTLINSIPSQVITIHKEGVEWGGSPFSQDDGPYYTTTSGDLVSIWTTSGFDTLYFFGASPGDHWLETTPTGATGPWVVTVVDTGTIVVDGLPLRYLVTDTDTIVERLGSLHGSFLPWVHVEVDDPGGPLRCYEDEDINYTATNWNYGCESWTGIPETVGGASIGLSPNPGSDHFTLTLPPGTHTITLFDATGRRVLSERTTDASVRVDTEAIPVGLYHVRVMDALGATQNTRWIKQ